jgi:hypothetical protein
MAAMLASRPPKRRRRTGESRRGVARIIRIPCIEFLEGLEVHLRAQLQPARIGDDLSRLEESRGRAIAYVIVPVVGTVEHIEHVQRNPDGGRRPAEAGEVFPEADIDIPVGECPWHLESAALVCVSGAAFSAEPARASNIQSILAAERCESGELDAPEVWQVGDPVRDDAVLLVVGRMLRNEAGGGEGEVIT